MIARILYKGDIIPSVVMNSEISLPDPPLQCQILLAPPFSQLPEPFLHVPRSLNFHPKTLNLTPRQGRHSPIVLSSIVYINEE